MSALDDVTWTVVALAAGYLLTLACGRGLRLPGPSWFDIPHDAGRAARRSRRRR